MTFSLLKWTFLGVTLATGPQAASAQEKLKIGMLVTLSGPGAILGQQARDGFSLALRDLGNKIAGREVELIVLDDELKPDVAVTRVKALIDRDKVDFIVGPTFSNVLQAIHKPVIDSRTFLISPNPGPSTFAGAACNPYFFVTSYNNDQLHEISGKVAQDRGYKRVYLHVPNYQAGKDAVAGFKTIFKGEIIEESYVPLGTLDFQAELSKIAAMKPDALYTFMPGGMGVNLVKQYKQAGLAGRIPFLSAATVDESTLPAQQDAAIGLYGSGTWAPNMGNPQSKAFVVSYEAAFDKVPGAFAAQGYDAALLINSAVTGANGDLAGKEALSAALSKADFTSLRGNFKFSNNGYPIEDLYLVRAAKRPDGKYQTEIAEKVFSNHADHYAKDCAIK